jgi:hypothetical protein
MESDWDEVGFPEWLAYIRAEAAKVKVYWHTSPRVNQSHLERVRYAKESLYLNY